jgi:hypothetical protein
VESATTTLLGVADQGYRRGDPVDLAELVAGDVFDAPIGIGTLPSQTVSRNQDKPELPTPTA